jgi:hypothetical protein
MTDPPPRALGADRIDDRDGEEVVLLCPVSKTWQGRTQRTTVRAAHPGTAVAWQERIYEVRVAEPLPDGGARYRLAPWEEGQTIRRFERYDEDSERGRAAARVDAETGARKRRLSILLAPLAGLLPGTVQKAMESEFGAPATGMTVSSALPLFVIGFLGMFGHILGMAGGTLAWPGWVAPPLPIALYLFGESALRLASAIAGGEPMGSFPVVVAHAAWKEARGEGTAHSTAPPSEKDREQSLRDRYSVLEPLLSLLPTPSQRVLEVRYGFDAARWGRITAGVLLAVGALNAIASLAVIAAGRGDLLDGIGLVVGGFLAAEQLHRLRVLSRGEPAGSVLGALIRPMAAPLLAIPEARARRSHDSPRTSHGGEDSMGHDSGA